MATSLSLQYIRRMAGEFAHRWKGTTQENANTQVFWTEFMAIFGVDSKRVVLFERHAQRLTTGQRGRIDVFWPGEMLIEQKSFGKNLTKAADQAFDYLDGLNELELPKLVVVSDFENFEVHDISASPIRITKFSLKQLPQRIGLFTWMAGYTRRSSVVESETEANKKAIKKMAALYDALTNDNFSDHHTSVFLSRILFLLFGEDTGLIERGLFAQLVKDRSKPDGSDLGGLLADLFQNLDTEPRNRGARTDDLIQRFPYVNGSVFSETLPLAHFDSAMRDALIAATDFEWGRISPAIFGSMFQAVKSKELRRELGEHYTSEIDIRKTLGPLFLDQLHADFEDAEFSVQKLRNLWDRIGRMKFLDPACGCGNFLIITYRELRELELQIMERLQILTGDAQTTLVDEGMGLKVSLAQFNGIEIEEWPARIAEVALFIADHQANRKMIETVGSAPDRLPLKVSANIVTTNALQIDWNWVVPASEDVIIVGNPPFGGQGKLTDQQVEDLKEVWGKARYQGYLDFVTAWYAKASSYYGDLKARWAFVSTSSIAQGEPVPALFGPLFEAGWRISFAHRGFNWVSEASGRAGVHVSIIGFDKAGGKAKLFTYADGGKGEPIERTVPNISPYLVPGETMFVLSSTNPVSPALPPVVYGNKPTDDGKLIVKADQYAEISADPRAAKYLRKFPGAKELINDLPRWCLWMVDLDPADVDSSPLLKERIEGVRTFRLNSTKAGTRMKAAIPHLFDQIRHPKVDYLAIPRHFTENRLFCTTLYCTPEIIQSDANFMAPDPDGFLFGVISSSLFMSWQRMVGGRIRSDLRFSNTVVWNNFPLPASVPEAARARVCDAAAGVMKARSLQDGKSLDAMYNPLAMRPELLSSHRVLDQAVNSLFGLRRSLETEAERQEFLFTRFTELAIPREAAKKAKQPQKRVTRAL